MMEKRPKALQHKIDAWNKDLKLVQAISAIKNPDLQDWVNDQYIQLIAESRELIKQVEAHEKGGGERELLELLGTLQIN